MSKTNLTTFYLIRHGETDWNKKSLLQGQVDIPLNKKGEKQAKELAQKLQHIPFDEAFSSDLLRTKRTSEIIALEKKLAVQTTHLLRERHFGDLQGKPSKALHTQIALLKKLRHEERLKHRFGEQSENDEEVIARVITFLRETTITHPGKNILVTTHGGIFHLLFIHLGVMTYEESANTRIANGAYIKITSDGVDFFVKETHGIEQRKQTDI